MTDPSKIDDASSPSQNAEIDELARIFSIVADAPKESQDAMLAELCPNSRLRKQVSELLDADSAEDSLLDHSLVPKPLGMKAGEYIAGYKLLQELAEGGMGVVFMAEQIEPIRRTVAIKVIKPGVDTREVIARFDAERQALSLMDHPNIAKVLDAGSTDAGRPFFVMELVKGQPITTYCKQNRLPTKKRLDLFLSVCYAIQHAHQKGIIHRDIKPSNVLVAEYDGRPVAKVIDFGVAKAINQSLTDMTMFTGFGQIIGTFEYMSPEQSRVNEMDVDTRTDIYSLGVLLYELLTGIPPFERNRFRSVGLEAMLKIIRDEDPARPSQRLSEQTKPSSKAEPGPDESAKLGRMLRGDLDWIVMKAMEKDRSRRYETPVGFANDIKRFLGGEAVMACPPTAMYRFGKFAKRNKVALVTTTVVAASLVVGLVGTTWQSVRALRAEKSAARSAVQSQAVNAFLVDDLLGLAGAESQLLAGLRPDPNLKLVTLLDRALARVDGRFPDQPQLKAELKGTLASSFSSIGRHNDATPLYEEWLDYLDASLGRKHPDTLHVMQQLARGYIDQSRFAAADPLCREALKSSREVLGNEHDMTLLLINDLAMLCQKQECYEESERLHKECLEIKRGLVGDGHADTLGFMSNLALLYEQVNRFEDAEKLHAQVLGMYQQLFVDDHPRVAAAMNNLGSCHLKIGRISEDLNRFEASVPLLSEGLAIYDRVRGPDHPDTLEIQSNLAQGFSELRRCDDAERLLSDLVERLGRTMGAKDESTLDAMNLLGWTNIHQGRFAEAENILTDTLEIRRLLNPKDPKTIQVMGNLAIAYHRMGKLEESILLDEKTQELATEVLGPNDVETLSATTRMGLSYLETGQSAKGRKLLENAFDTSQTFSGAFRIAKRLADSYSREADAEKTLLWTDRQIAGARTEHSNERLQLAKVLNECGSRLLKMKAWKQSELIVREYLSIIQEQASDSWVTLDAQSMLGEALTGQKKYDEAKPLLLESYRGLTQRADEDPTLPDTKRLGAIDRLIVFSNAIGDPEMAAQWRKERANLLASVIR